ncbi:MAG TPA: FHA domain-containing protein, partial [Acidimicrobiales bacterium]|nr:FHA domain-containing protein [Acidimicrobiales bacterium]
MVWDDDRRTAALLGDPGGAAPARVPVVFSLGGAGLDLELALAPAATVGDVMAALAGGPVGEGTALLVDGRAVRAHVAAGEAGLRPGSTLELGTAPVDRPGAGPGPVAELRVVGGLTAGARWALPPGRWRLGRADGAGGRHGPRPQLALDAPTLSAAHLELAVDPGGAVTVADLGSHNGTRLDGEFVRAPAPVGPGRLIEAGAVQLSVVPPPPTAGRPAAGAFNRPPRPSPPAASEALVVPEQPPDPNPRSRLAWAAMLAPLAMGAVMALIWDPRMALFALFTPVMMLGTWWEDRRRARKEGRRSSAALAAEIDAFKRAVAAAATEALARLRQARPDPAEVIARVAGGDTRLWERRPSHPDFLVLSAGTGAVPWQPPLRDGGRRAPQ